MSTRFGAQNLTWARDAQVSPDRNLVVASCRKAGIDSTNDALRQVHKGTHQEKETQHRRINSFLWIIDLHRSSMFPKCALEAGKPCPALSRLKALGKAGRVTKASRPTFSDGECLLELPPALFHSCSHIRASTGAALAFWVGGRWKMVL